MCNKAGNTSHITWPNVNFFLRVSEINDVLDIVNVWTGASVLNFCGYQSVSSVTRVDEFTLLVGGYYGRSRIWKVPVDCLVKCYDYDKNEYLINKRVRENYHHFVVMENR